MAPLEAIAPKSVVVVLLDSLNRHLLGCYGGHEFETPNLDRFARERATRFTRHVTGSLPCMPARHDILCGALDFLWKPWGSIELWEEPITVALREAGVTTMLVSDHPHLFEAGGENYHTDFRAWDYLRGHEGDPWKTYLDPSWVGAPALPAVKGGWFWQRIFAWPDPIDRGYDRSRTFFRDEQDYPGPKTMKAAAAWLREATPHHERFLLFVDEFDPHEPFDTPALWQGRYEDAPFEGEQLIWPPYVNGGVSGGHLSRAEARHIRANYGSKLSMIDHWLDASSTPSTNVGSGRAPPSCSAPTTATTWGKCARGGTSGGSRASRSSSPSATPPCWSPGPVWLRAATATPSPRTWTSTPPWRTSSGSRRRTAPMACRWCRSCGAKPTPCAAMRSAASTATGSR